MSETTRELFLVKVKIKDRQGEIHKLSKGVSLEITWNGNKGKGKKEGKIIKFEENGKEFPILVKIEKISRNKNRVNNPTIYSLSPVEGNDFDLEYDQESQKQGWRKKQEKQWNVVEISQGKIWWKEYPFLIPVIGIAFLLLMGGILAWWLWRKKKQKQF